MKILKINLQKITPPTINSIAGALKNNQVLVLPTDTVYGLSCRADNRAALRRIYRLKKKDPRRPLLILVSDLAMLKKYAVVSSRQEKELKKIWFLGRRPTTIILKDKGKLPSELSLDSGLAVRLPKSIFLIKIIEKLRAPLVSTSLNLSGQAPISSLADSASYFSQTKLLPDVFIDAGPCRRSKISKILDLRDIDKPVILRK